VGAPTWGAGRGRSIARLCEFATSSSGGMGHGTVPNMHMECAPEKGKSRDEMTCVLFRNTGCSMKMVWETESDPTIVS
jgi:hypothetical protein